MLGVFLMAIVVCGVASFPKLEASLPQMDCADCKKYVGQVKNYHETATKQKVEARIALCKVFPELADECTDIVTKYFDEIYDYINTNFNSDEICSLAGLCDETNVHEPQMTSANDFNHEKYTDNGFGCDFCQQIVKYDVDLITMNLTDELVKDFLLGNCKHLGIDEQTCDDFVNDNFEALLKLILKKSDPKTICTVMRVCGEKNVYKPKKRSVIDFNREKKNAEDCIVCERAMQDVIGLIDTSTEDDVKNLLYDVNVCKRNGKLDQECDDRVNNNVRVVFNLIIEKATPQEICAAIGLCDQTKMRSVTDFYRGKKIAEDCIVCERAMQDVIDLTDTTSTEDDVKNLIFSVNVCKRNGKLEQECDDIVNNKVRVVFNLIIEKATPREICRAVRLCDQIPRKTQSLPLPKQIPTYHELHDINPSSYTCTLCKVALQAIQIMLNNNNTEENIKHAIETVCDVLPTSITEDCNDFIETYGDAILILISQQLDPTLVCVKLGLCDSGEAPVDIQLPARLTVAETNVKTRVCNICQKLIEIIHLTIILQDDKTKEGVERVVEHELDSVCNNLPQQYQADCESYSDEYAEQLVDLVVNDDPDTICATLDLCPASKKTVAKPTSTRQR